MKIFISLLLVSVVVAHSPTNNNYQTSRTRTSQTSGASSQGPARQSKSVNPRPSAGPVLPNPYKAVSPFAREFGLAQARFGGRGGIVGVAHPDRVRGNNHPNYGPKVFGMGLQNAWAAPHSKYEVQQGLKIVEANPNLLLRVDADGDVELTNQFGMEVDARNAYGYDLDEFIEAPEYYQHGRRW